MQTMHIHGTLYVSGNITFHDPKGLPLNVYAQKNVVMNHPDKKPWTMEAGDVYIDGDLKVQGHVGVDEQIGTAFAYTPVTDI